MIATSNDLHGLVTTEVVIADMYKVGSFLMYQIRKI